MDANGTSNGTFEAVETVADIADGAVENDAAESIIDSAVERYLF